MRGSRSSAEEEDDHRPICHAFFFQALALNSPLCSLPHDGGGMTRSAVSTPPAAPATLGDGCSRTVSPGRGSAGHPLARIAQLRRGCCPPPASLLQLARGCCKPPLNRASQQLPLLSCFWRYTQPPSERQPRTEAATGWDLEAVRGVWPHRSSPGRTGDMTST